MPSRRRHASALAALLAVALVAPAPSLAGPPAAAGRALPGAGPRDGGGSAEPSIHYEDAQRHAGDRIAFTAGGRVDVPFRPRRGDDWSIGGRAPRELPAGSRSGRDIAAGDAADRGTPADASPAPGSTPSSPVEAVPSADPSLPEALAPERMLSAPVAASGLHREVFGFLPYWELRDSRLDYGVLSTIAYFGVGADRSGHLIRKRSDGTTDTGWAGWTSSTLTNIINAAHTGGTRVVLTVQRFGWTSGQASDTKTLLSSATARQALANEIAATVHDRGADGANLDFEPIPSGQGANFVTFVRQVRVALDAQAPGYQLTFDSTGSIGNYDIGALTSPGAADAVFIMGYDYRTSSSNNAGSISPLSGPRYDLTDTVASFLGRTSASKIILGVPYYGRAWSTTSDAPNATTRSGSSTYGYSSSVVYATAAAYAASKGRRWDATEGSPWAAYHWQYCSTCPTTWRELYYDDAQSLGLKYDLVNTKGLRGAGIWALGYDGTRLELYAVLAAKFLEDHTPPQAGIALLPEPTRDEGIRVRWTARDDWSGVDRYDLQVSVGGGAWTAWLTATTATSGTFPGRNGQGYAFRVRARDGKGNWSAWAVGDVWQATPDPIGRGAFARVTADTLSLRTAPDTSAMKVRSLSASDRVRIVDGPVSADGYSWYEVRGPLSEWGPVTATAGGWIAASSSAGWNIAAVGAPSTTTVDAMIANLAIGAVNAVSANGPSSSGSSSPLVAAFSPNGDGVRDGLRLTYDLDATLDSLALRIYRAADLTLIGTRALPGLVAGSHAYDWDGRLNGDLVPDGAYVVQLQGLRAGRTYAAPAPDVTDPTLTLGAVRFRVDTTPPTLTAVSAGPAAISPNGDGRQDVTKLAASGSSDAASWSIDVRSPGGSRVRSFSGAGGSAVVTWDGRDTAGGRVADGVYGVIARVSDSLGNATQTVRTVTVDTVSPTGSVSAAAHDLVAGATTYAFSPDGDRWQDATFLRWRISEPVWGSLAVRSSSGTRWAAHMATGVSGWISWAGRDRYGRTLGDGTYRLLASVTDLAGNRAAIYGPVRIDRTAGFLRTTPTIFFPQDRDTLARTTAVSFRLSRSATTTLRILDRRGTAVRTAWSGRARAAGTTSWTWDGRDGTAAIVPRGVYTVELVASSNGYRQIIRRTVRLDAFAISPSVTTATAGDRVTFVIASAEPLAAAPKVTLTQAGLAYRTVLATRRSDGRYQATFTIAAGGVGTATVTVRATDTVGGTNTSATTFRVR